MLKILFYSHTGKVSGAENILLLTLRRLNREKFAVSAVCPSAGGLADEIRALGISCQTVNPLEARFTWRLDLFIRYLISFFRTIKDLRSKIARENPDLIHANSIRAGLAATTATFGMATPVFWHLQDELQRHPLSTIIRLFVLASKRTRLIAASSATGDSFRGKIISINRIPLRVIHNVIELEKFRFDPGNMAKIRQELQLGDEEIVYGIVGQITPRKGQLELVETFAATLEKMPSSTLLIIGEPMFNQDHDYLRQIEDAIERFGLEGKIRLLGPRQDVPAMMQAMDVLTVNSKSEALVVVAIEAMASGTPVIATDVGGTREMIEHGVNGWIVPSGDKGLLSEAIIELGQDPDLRQRLGSAGRKVVEERFNAGIFITNLENFLTDFTPKTDPQGELLFFES